MKKQNITKEQQVKQLLHLIQPTGLVSLLRKIILTEIELLGQIHTSSQPE